MDIIISASLAYDKIMDFPGFFKDHIMPDKIHILSVSFFIDKLTEKRGGVAGNIAYSLKLLGENPKIIATAGKDFGDYKNYLEKLKIETRGIKIIKNELTACARIITDKADNQIAAFHSGAMNFSDQASLNDLDFDKNNAIALIGPDSKAGMKKRAQECKKFKIPFIFDPGQSIILWNQNELRQLIKSAKIFIVNDYELELAKERAKWDLDNILNNVNVLIVTLGEKGSVIYDQKKKLKIPAVKAKNVDPTGAGDAYRAGILKGLANGWDWEKTGRLASFCGACAVEHYGTQEHKISLKSVKSIKSKVVSSKNN